MRRLLLAAALGLCACGSTTIDATRYDHSCISVSECVPVTSGDVCEPCRCANAAINAKDQARFDADAKSLAATCRGVPAVLCGPCPTAAATCEAQVCVLVK